MHMAVFLLAILYDLLYYKYFVKHVIFYVAYQSRHYNHVCNYAIIVVFQ